MLCCWGPPGVGKTHLAIGLVIKAAEVGHRVLFLILAQLTYPKVLVLDEIDYPRLSGEDTGLRPEN